MIALFRTLAILVPLALVACGAPDDVHHSTDAGADGAKVPDAKVNDAPVQTDAAIGGTDAAVGATISFNFKIDTTFSPGSVTGFSNPKLTGYLDFYVWDGVAGRIITPILGSTPGVIEGTLTIAVGPVATVSISKPPAVAPAAVAQVNASLTTYFDHAEGSPNPDQAHILIYRTSGAWTDADEAAMSALGCELTPVYIGHTGVATGWGDWGGLNTCTTLPQILRFSI